MNNPETMTTLGTQDIGMSQTKQKPQHRKLKWWANHIYIFAIMPFTLFNMKYSHQENILLISRRCTTDVNNIQLLSFDEVNV
jgi:hypothetical protein